MKEGDIINKKINIFNISINEINENISLICDMIHYIGGIPNCYEIGFILAISNNKIIDYLIARSYQYNVEYDKNEMYNFVVKYKNYKIIDFHSHPISGPVEETISYADRNAIYKLRNICKNLIGFISNNDFSYISIIDGYRTRNLIKESELI